MALSLGGEIDLDKLDNYVKDKVINPEYLEALFKKIHDEDSQEVETVVNLKATFPSTDQDIFENSMQIVLINSFNKL